MKIRTRLLALVVPALLFGSEPSLEFSAYMSSSAGARFVVTEIASRKASDWLREGDSFAGYTITGFDPKDELLTVRKGDATSKLSLKKASVRDGVVVAPAQTVSSTYSLTLANDGSIPDREALKDQFVALRAKQPEAKIRLQLPEGAGNPDTRGAMKVVYQTGAEVGLKILGVTVFADPSSLRTVK